MDGHLLLVGRELDLENEAVRYFADDPADSDSDKCLGQQLDMTKPYSRSLIVGMGSR